MNYENEKTNIKLFDRFKQFVENTQSSENLEKDYEYEKNIDSFKSLTFERWTYYFPDHDSEASRDFKYISFRIVHEGYELSEIESKLQNNENYEILINLFGYFPVLGNSTIFCLNLLNYHDIFLDIINNHTHIGAVILDFIDNYLNYTKYTLNYEQKERFNNKYLTELKYYARDIYLDKELEQKYIPNTIVHDNRQVLFNDLIGRITKTHRFLLLSSHIHQLASDFNFKVFRSYTGHFKVLDVFEYNGHTQITLLHLPDDLWMIFEKNFLDLDDLIKKARTNFIESFDLRHYRRLNNSRWTNSAFPIGLKENGDYIEEFYTNHTSDGRSVEIREMNLKTKMIITRQFLDYYSPEIKKGKYPAPEWLVYPEIPLGSIGWRMGYGEEYAMNSFIFTRMDKNYKKLFPEPLTWSRKYLKEFREKNDFRTSFFALPWSEDGAPKYNFKNAEKEAVTFIDDTFVDGEFQVGANRYESLKDAMNNEKEHNMETWDKTRYLICLNMLYYKIMQNDHLRNQLLETRDKLILFENSDAYWGVGIYDNGIIGENHLGFALMELRDEIKRIYQNSASIDWFLTEYLKTS